MPDKRLVVLDESTEPSPYFSEVKDPDVTYVHRAAQPRTDGLSRVGAARNAANALTPDGAILVHLDDDDILAPSYAAQMIDRLGDADLCKLDVWRILHEASGLLFEWDTRKVGDKHYALLGDSVAAAAEATAEITREFMELLGVRDGFGFSLVYPRKTWERHPFPNEDTEDLPFVQSVRDAGGKIVFVSDLPHLVLHLVSKMSKIACYPQRLLGAAAAEKQARLRSAVAHRMIGAMGEMAELQAGKTISLAPGSSYSVLAEVKNKHSLRALTNRAERMGVTITSARDNVDASEFGAPEPADGYRLVLAIGSPSDPKMLPWKAPGFFATYDKSHVVKAWTGAGVSEGTKARSAHDIVKGRPDDAFGAGDVVERYDPKRYAGKEPPHRCTAASATAIAQQLPGAPWVYAGIVTSHDGMRESTAPVTTPMGSKTIPYWTDNLLPGGGRNRGLMPTHLIIQCPYTGEMWSLFAKRLYGTGAARPLGAGATPSLAQLGMSAAGSAGISLDTTYVTSQVDPSGAATSTGTSLIATAGGWSQMTEQQQTQYGEAVTTAIAGVALPGAGAILAQLLFTAFGVAGSGPGCTCPNCPEPFEPMPPVSSATPGNAGSFESMCNQTGLQEWATDATCAGYKIAGWNSASSSLAAWFGIVSTNATAWNQATGTDGPGMYDVDGILGLSGAPLGFLQVPGPTVPAGKLLIVRTVQASKPDPSVAGISQAAFGDVIGMALDYMASVANGNDGSFSWTNNGSIPANTQISFMVNNGATKTPAQIQSLPIHVPGPPVQNGKGGDTPAASKGLAVAGLLVAGAAVAAGVGIWGMSQGLGYGAAWKALGSKLAAQTTASGNLLLGSRVPMLAAEKSRSRRARRRA